MVLTKSIYDTESTIRPKTKSKEESKDDKEWMYAQRNSTELPGDYFERQGWHPPKEN